jgi:hypothetical protein
MASETDDSSTGDKLKLFFKIFGSMIILIAAMFLQFYISDILFDSDYSISRSYDRDQKFWIMTGSLIGGLGVVIGLIYGVVKLIDLIPSEGEETKSKSKYNKNIK